MLSRKIVNRLGLLILELVGANTAHLATENTLVPAASAIAAGVVEPFLKENCLRCHGPNKSNGELRFDQLDADLTKPTNFERWREIMSRVQSGDMPPDTKPRPKPEQVADFLKRLAARLNEASRKHRGVWVLDRILGRQVPPPPPNVPAVEPDIRGAITIREQLAKHRETQTCAHCHIQIDPPGFALENYDVIGGWRDRYRVVAERKE